MAKVMATAPRLESDTEMEVYGEDRGAPTKEPLFLEGEQRRMSCETYAELGAQIQRKERRARSPCCKVSGVTCVPEPCRD